MSIAGSQFERHIASAAVFIFTGIYPKITFYIYDMRHLFFSMLFFLLSAIAIFLFHLIPWAVNTFPLDYADAVLFTLFTNMQGSREFVIGTLKSTICAAFYDSAALLALQLAISKYLYIKNFSFHFNLFHHTFFIFKPGRFIAIFYRLQKQIFFIFALVCMGALCFYIPINSYCKLFYTQFIKGPENSELYEKHYVFPDSVKVTFPEHKRNLIVIWMESMETDYQDKAHGGSLPRNLIPEITEISKRSLSFSPGGESIAGTDWTMGAQVAKLCGLPLILPWGQKKDISGIPGYVPYAKCLTDILASQGYKEAIVQGSDSKFSSLDAFVGKHGNAVIHDLQYYKQQKLVSLDYNKFWGIEDAKLYNFAKDDILKFSKSEPFAIFISTIDTHQPHGYISDNCPERPMQGEEQYPFAIQCASKQIKDFLNWAKTQPWYTNTTIAIMGDHSSYKASAAVGVPAGTSLYWINLFINSSQTAARTQRKFSSFDMYPTVLEAMGVQIEGHTLGLGVSLFSDKPTLLETYSRKTLDSLLLQKSHQYNYFLYGKAPENTVTLKTLSRLSILKP